MLSTFSVLRVFCIQCVINSWANQELPLVHMRKLKSPSGEMAEQIFTSTKSKTMSRLSAALLRYHPPSCHVCTPLGFTDSDQVLSQLLSFLTKAFMWSTGS